MELNYLILNSLMKNEGFMSRTDLLNTLKGVGSATPAYTSRIIAHMCDAGFIRYTGSEKESLALTPSGYYLHLSLQQSANEREYYRRQAEEDAKRQDRQEHLNRNTTKGAAVLGAVTALLAAILSAFAEHWVDLLFQ